MSLVVLDTDRVWHHCQTAGLCSLFFVIRFDNCMASCTYMAKQFSQWLVYKGKFIMMSWATLSERKNGSELYWWSLAALMSANWGVDFCVANYRLFATAYTNTNCLELSPDVGCFCLDPDLSSLLRTNIFVASHDSLFWNRCQILGYASILILNLVIPTLLWCYWAIISILCAPYK